MKKVLLIGSELGKGGAERSLSLLSYYLSDAYEVTLCILSGKNRKRFYPTCSRIIFVDPPDVSTWPGKAYSWYYRIKTLRKVKAETGCDVAISFLEGPNYANVLSRGSEKVLLGVRGSNYFDGDIKGIKGWFRKKILIPWLYPKADKVICASQQLTEELQHYFRIPPARLGYVYNLYDPEQIRRLAAEDLSHDEAAIFSQPVILHAGRMHPQKNQLALVEFFAMQQRKGGLRLVFLGDGNMKPDLVAKALGLGLTVCDMQGGMPFHPADIYFLGFNSNPFKFYARSRLFVLCSGWEGFPNVLAEALICRVPVLAADCPTGPREILNIAVAGMQPTRVAHRVSVGSLLPLLDITDTAAISQWQQEFEFWLQQPQVPEAAFEELTARFSRQDVLEKWSAFIGVCHECVY